MRYRKTEAKEWAKGHYRGLESLILPSFKADTLALDEAGVRHDVREQMKHGFFSTVLVTETGTTKEEDKKLVQWCTDEAGGEMGVALSLRYYTIEDNVEMARFAESVGCESLVLCYPPNFQPKSESEVYDFTEAICGSTNLAVELFPSMKYDWPFPGVFPARLLAQMGDIPNAVAVKLGNSADLAWVDECFRLCGDKLLLSVPWDYAWPTYIRKYGMQWSGCAPWHLFQTADDPRESRMFNLIQEGRMDEAMEIYWKIDPLRWFFAMPTRTQAAAGLYCFQQWKYMEGLVGMTGGEMRMPKIEYSSREKAMARKAMLASGMRLVDQSARDSATLC